MRCPGGVNLEADELLPEDVLLAGTHRRRWSWSSHPPGLDLDPPIDHEEPREADVAVVGVVRGDTSAALPLGRVGVVFLWGEKESMGGGSTRAWFQPLDRLIGEGVHEGGEDIPMRRYHKQRRTCVSTGGRVPFGNTNELCPLKQGR